MVYSQIYKNVKHINFSSLYTTFRIWDFLGILANMVEATYESYSKEAYLSSRNWNLPVQFSDTNQEYRPDTSQG